MIERIAGYQARILKGTSRINEIYIFLQFIYKQNCCFIISPNEVSGDIMVFSIAAASALDDVDALTQKNIQRISFKSDMRVL